MTIPCGFPFSRKARTAKRDQLSIPKLSGPLLDRIDLHIEVPAVPYKELRDKGDGSNSAEMRGRVGHAAVDSSSVEVAGRVANQPSFGGESSVCPAREAVQHRVIYVRAFPALSVGPGAIFVR